jgi:hypothetical protein
LVPDQSMWNLCRTSVTVTGVSVSTSVSPVSIIPPTLHTHPFTYHQRCIMFLSQHFSFPCQYHSTNAPYPSIHLPPTLYNVSLPVLQFPLSVSFHQFSTYCRRCMLSVTTYCTTLVTAWVRHKVPSSRSQSPFSFVCGSQ